MGGIRYPGRTDLISELKDRLPEGVTVVVNCGPFGESCGEYVVTETYMFEEVCVCIQTCLCVCFECVCC